MLIVQACNFSALGEIPLAETKGLAATRTCPSLLSTPCAEIKPPNYSGFFVALQLDPGIFRR